MLLVSGTFSIVAYLLDRTVPLNLYLGLVLYADAVISHAYSSFHSSSVVSLEFATCFVPPPCQSFGLPPPLCRAVATYIGERSTSRFSAIFKRILPAAATAIRDGAEVKVAAADLVVGDVVRVCGGEKVPADIRIVQSRELQVEASAITGESEPILVTSEPCDDPSVDATHSPNIIFNGSACLQGEGVGVVIQTGDRTLLGRIAQLAGNQQQEQTPMQKDVAKFIRILAIFSVVLAAIFFIIGVAQNPGNALNIFINAFILVTIANVPQGLPGTVTSLLTITGRKMARRNVYVKRLDSVETLGSCSVIATDKTGTLTENKMSVENVWVDLESNPYDKIVRAPKAFFNSSGFSNLFRIAALCSRVVVTQAETPAEDDATDNRVRRSMEYAMSRRSMDFADEAKVMSGNSTIPESLVRYVVEPLSLVRQPLVLQRVRLCSRSVQERNAGLKLMGDASEVALYRFCNAILRLETYKANWPKMFEIPFNSKNKYQLSIHKDIEASSSAEDGSRCLLVIKGAPEIILERCAYFLNDGETKKIKNSFKKRFEAAYKKFGGQGERVLGFAFLPFHAYAYF